MKKILFLAGLLFVSEIVFSQDYGFISKLPPQPEEAVYSVSSDDALLQGYESFKNEDWISAMFFLRKAISDPKNSTDDVRYMLIVAETFAGEYKLAEKDCNDFRKDFPSSAYKSFVEYQQGRSLHYLGDNERSVIMLSDFCHENPDSELYPSALYWIAECFYSEYNYDSARALYERIVTEYPDDEKAIDAQYKLDSIDQRSREEKLLYLLKMTGEEYLAAKEDFERQIRMYKARDAMGYKNSSSQEPDELPPEEPEKPEIFSKMPDGKNENNPSQEYSSISPYFEEPVTTVVPNSVGSRFASDAYSNLSDVEDSFAKKKLPPSLTEPQKNLKNTSAVKNPEMSDSEVDSLKRKVKALQTYLTGE